MFPTIASWTLTSNKHVDHISCPVIFWPLQIVVFAFRSRVAWLLLAHSYIPWHITAATQGRHTPCMQWSLHPFTDPILMWFRLFCIVILLNSNVHGYFQLKCFILCHGGWSSPEYTFVFSPFTVVLRYTDRCFWYFVRPICISKIAETLILCLLCVPKRVSANLCSTGHTGEGSIEKEKEGREWTREWTVFHRSCDVLNSEHAAICLKCQRWHLPFTDN